MLQRAKHFITTRTGKLALTYLAIIMTMTLVFSVVIFTIASNQFDRPLPPHNDARSLTGNSDSIQELFDQRAADAKLELLTSLLLLNIGMFGFGAWFSVHLAKLTMEPIEQAMQEQSRFVTDASHELRTPLTALRSVNEVALRRKNMNDDDARELARKNIAEITKLHTLTTSLLGLIHTEQMALVPQPVALQQVVGDAMEAVVAAAQERKISVTDTTPNVTVLSQPDQLTQVVRILLENAVKYSHPKGEVGVAAVPAGDTVTLTVSDTGIGISKADLPHIFSRFYRADESRSKVRHEGYGLGLAIAKSISDQLGMNLAVKSQLGKGSEFSVVLPLHHTP